MKHIIHKWFLDYDMWLYTDKINIIPPMYFKDIGFITGWDDVKIRNIPLGDNYG